MKIKTDFILLMPVFFSGTCQALDWYYSPSMTVNERYTDNLRLQIAPPTPSGNFITTVSPALTGGYIDSNNEFYGNFNWNQLLYHNDPNLDFSEKIGKLFYQYTGERWSANFTGTYGDQASLAAESVQLGAFGSGVIGIQVARYSRFFAPSMTYKLDEKNSLQLSGSYMDTNFGAHPISGLGFSGFISKGLSLTGSHVYSEKLSFNVSGSYSGYSAKNNVPEIGAIADLNEPPTCALTQTACIYDETLAYRSNSDTYSLQMGMNYAFTETMALNLSVGARRTNSNTSEVLSNRTVIDGFIVEPPSPQLSTFTSTINGQNYSGSFSKTFEKGGFSINASQQLSPASTGTQQQVTQFSLSGNYGLSERWSSGFMGTYLTSDTISTLGIGGASSNPAAYNRIYVTLAPNIKWQWTPDLTAQLTYTYINQEFTLSHADAYANSLQLQFVYQPILNRQVK
ncbi:MAG: hypothetical protein ABSB19_14580 [Methylomonas sp.]|jgi:hypothetical protein